MNNWRRTRHFAPAVTVAIVGVVASIAGWYLAMASEHRAFGLEFAGRADNQAIILQDGIDDYWDRLYAIRALFDSSKQAVTREEFERFSNSLLAGRAAILNIAWVPRVRRAERAAHELAAARDGLVDYHIRAVVSDGSLPVAPERDEYFPKFYSTAARASPVYGLDLNDEGIGARVIARIRDGDVLSISPPLMLHIGEGDRRGFWAGVPVYARGVPHETVEDRRHNLLGIVQGVFQIGAMIDTILAGVKTPVRIYLFAANAGEHDLPIYFTSRLGAGSIEARSQAELTAGLHRSFPINFGDVQWTLVVAPELSGPIAFGQGRSSIVLLFGLLLSGGLTLFVWAMRRANDKFRQQNLQLDAALSSMALGFLMFGPAGELITSNRRAADLFGVPWERWKVSATEATVPQIMQLVHGHDMLTEQSQATIAAALQGVLDSGEMNSIEFERTDGRLFSASCAPMTGGGSVVTFVDITERHATLRRTQAQLEVVARLSKADAVKSGDVEGFASQVTELAAMATGCARVNAWLFNDDESELRCIDLFESRSGQHSAGMVLNERDFKDEFQALRESRYVNADDPLTDSRTKGYVESYLKPLGITAMLDAVIHTAGKNLGLLCFEHVNKPHHWEQDEIAFACLLADKIGLELLNRDRQQAESELRDSESRFRTIFNTVSEAIFAHDLQTGDLVDVNMRAAEMFGYSRDEILRGDIGMLSTGTPPYTLADASARLAAAAAGDSPPFEWHFRSRDGRLFWGEVSLRRTVFGSREVVLAAVHDITWRKQAEQELQFANTLLTTELETSPDGVLVVDNAGKIVSFNHQFVEMWRIPLALIEARVDEPILAAVTAQMLDPDTFLARVRHLLLQPDEKGDDELVTRDGRIVDRHSAPLKAPSGQYLGRVWFFRDVTEKRRSEIKLREDRDFTAALIESLPGFFVLIDESGHLVRWNENLPALTGLSDAQLEGHDALAIIVESDRDMARMRLQEAFSEGRAEVEVGVPAKDGNVRRVLWYGRKLMNADRPYLLAIGLDVTEARAAETRLRASEERFRAVSETAQDAIITIDAAARVTFWNRAAERIFGYTAEESIGKNVHEWLTPPRFREEVATGMATFSATGHGDVPGKTMELAAIRKDGAEIPIELSVAGMRLGTEWHAVAMLRDITERKHAEEQMARMARHDILTGLANRAVFVEALQFAMVSARRSGKGIAVLYLDLDHFKDINDTLGHPVGDLLLQAVSRRLQETIREPDTVARFGGDEFAVIESDFNDPADAAVMAENILEALRAPFPIQGNDIRTGASVGIAIHGPDSPDAEALLSHADVALYRAKSEGRGTYRFFTDAMDTEVRSRVALGNELREGIASGQLFLMYQPQVDVDTGRIAGVEALARWRHPKRGLISPGEFIPVAEKNGLIVELGHWVLQEACRQMREWFDAGIAPPLMAVNVSGMQFKTPFELEKGIAAILAKTALPPHLLELELTESVLMKASEQRNDVLLRLRNSGVRIAIDDFGTGYSSLEYLSRFPVDRIKIAQNFIVNLTSGSDNATIVKAAIGLANDLKRNVIVEGVETAEQLALIRSWGCHNVQGFYFFKPLPALEIKKLLRRRTVLPARAIVTETAA